MSKQTYAFKPNVEGVIQRFKARIFARGDQTKEGIDYEETFSLVLKWESIRLFLALTVLLRLSSVFIYSIRRNHIQEPPDGGESPTGMVFRLIKSMISRILVLEAERKGMNGIYEVGAWM